MGIIMLVSIFSPKGGVGVSTTSALFAKALSRKQPTYLVETGKGDLEAILALDEKAKFGFFDWAVSEKPSFNSLKKIAISFDNKLALVVGEIAKSSTDNEYCDRQLEYMQTSQFNCDAIVESLINLESHCVVDCGNSQSRIQKQIIEASDLVVLVLRQCYLGLYRATKSELTGKVDAVVVIEESGRSISSNQIAQTLGCNILLQIDARRDFARTIDSGTLWSRTPDKLIGPIAQYIQDLDEVDVGIESSNDIFQDSSRRNILDFWNEPDKATTKSGMSSFSPQFADYAKQMLNQDS